MPKLSTSTRLLLKDFLARSGKLLPLEYDRLVFIANCVAGSDLPHAADGDDLPRASYLDVFPLIRVHPHQTANTFSCVFDRVISVGTSFDGAAVNAHERK